MSEIFDIITAINRLKDQVKDLNTKIDGLCKNPSMIASDKFYDEPTACKVLHLKYRAILKLRKNGEISFIRHNHQILYPVSAIDEFIASRTVFSKQSA